MVTILKKGTNKSTIKKLVKKSQSKKGIDAKKHCGVIKLKEHPLEIQKTLRDEWK
jgi:hypothetical protein